MILTYQIIRHCSSRSTSYSWRSVERVIKDYDLTWKHPDPKATMIAEVRKETATREEALTFRRSFEGALRVVHRNIPFILSVTKE